MNCIVNKISEFMAILNFIKPDKVIMLDSSNTKGVFEFRPLEPGYGITVGNAIRRVLLNSLEGYAICSIRISDIDHEFATIPGVITDVTNLILNLKQVRFKRKPEIENETETAKIRIRKQKVFTAGDLNTVLSHFEVLNPELLLAEMDETADFELELTINKGRDEKLTLEILTDGSITPKEALKEAAKILIFHFMLFSDEKIIIEEESKSQNNQLDEEILRMRQLLNQRLQDIDLSVRALNCLKAAEVSTLGELVTYHRSDLLKFRNFGKKSLTELDELLERNGLSFGMDISKYAIKNEDN